jgi:RNA methyltransferase, TrmH family
LRVKRKSFGRDFGSALFIVITSKKNQRLKELMRLQDRKHRRETGLFVAEGEDLVAEALRHGVVPETIFSVHGAGLPFELPGGVEHFEATSEALSAASNLGSGARVIGVFKVQWTLLEPHHRLGGGGQFLFLHDVSDPGNVGTAIRSAHAFGAGAVVLGERTADPFGPKAVRASMGAIFAVPVARTGLEEARTALAARAVALVPGAGAPLRELDLASPVLFVCGSERGGLPESLVESCDDVAHVPLAPGGAESLNVAMTATLCLYESAVHRLSPSVG